MNMVLEVLLGFLVAGLIPTIIYIVKLYMIATEIKERLIEGIKDVKADNKAYTTEIREKFEKILDRLPKKD